MLTQLNRLTLAFVAGFAALGLAVGYWSLVRSDELLARGDNARRVLLERRFPRGPITDRNGAVLAEARGLPGELVRYYPYAALAPVVGYISPLYGTVGIEATFDGILHGDDGYATYELDWANLVGAQPPGRGVQLTIDLAIQTAADAALGARAGAVVVVNSETGEILAMASHPTYDANQLDEQWSALAADEAAPLLNRATAALYQPGGAVWPVVIAAAFQAGYVGSDQTFTSAPRPVLIGDQQLTCRTPPPAARITLTDTLRLGCPSPIASLGGRLGSDRLAALFDDFRLLEAPAIGLPTIVAETGSIADPGLAAVGQAELTLTPLHVALLAAAIAEDGALPAPRLVLAVQDRAGQWQPWKGAGSPVAAVGPVPARQVKALLAGGLTATALTGTSGETIAWYIGFAPAGDSRYAVAALLEDGDADAATAIGQTILRAALTSP